jgi:transcription termination/antitermination protein NusG
VLIPTEKVSEVKKGVKTTHDAQVFPGLRAGHMALYDEQRQLNEKAWYFIRRRRASSGLWAASGRCRCAGGSGRDLNQVEEKKEKVKPKVVFEPGETVKITDGPFLNFRRGGRSGSGARQAEGVGGDFRAFGAGGTGVLAGGAGVISRPQE